MIANPLEFSSPSPNIAIVLGDMKGMYPDHTAVLEAVAFMLSFGSLKKYECLLEFDALAFYFSDSTAAMIATVALPKIEFLGRYRVIKFGYLSERFFENKSHKLALPPILPTHAFSTSDISPSSRRPSIRALDDADFAGVTFTGQRSPSRYASSRTNPPTLPTTEALQERQQLDIEPHNIAKDPRCTLMMRNLPKGLTQADFFEKFSSRVERVEELIDFVYMPFDSAKQQNFGYVFLNARDLDKVGVIYKIFHGKSFFQDSTQTKSCQVAYARLQGRDKFIAQFNREAVLKLPKQLRPLILDYPAESFKEFRPRADSAASTAGRSAVGDSVWGRYSESDLDDTGRIAEAVAEFALPTY
jgi:RNA recognition motif 2